MMGHESGKVTFFEGKKNDSAPVSAYQTTAPESGSTASSKTRQNPHHVGKGAGRQKAHHDRTALGLPRTITSRPVKRLLDLVLAHIHEMTQRGS